MLCTSVLSAYQRNPCTNILFEIEILCAAGSLQLLQLGLSAIFSSLFDQTQVYCKKFVYQDGHNLKKFWSSLREENMTQCQLCQIRTSVFQIPQIRKYSKTP